jgi:hypothetical protein
MKALLMLSLGLTLECVGAQAWTYYSTSNTDIQDYEVVVARGDYEIRKYPGAHLASVTKLGNMNQMSWEGFRDLAGYIFGGNDESRSIPMTSPVRMVDLGDSTIMSFVMPEQDVKKGLPNPLSRNVRLEETKAMYAATLRFGGYMRQTDLEAKKADLKAWLESQNIKYLEPFEFLAYNPPYQMVGRRNEVFVRVEF